MEIRRRNSFLGSAMRVAQTQCFELGHELKNFGVRKDGQEVRCRDVQMLQFFQVFEEFPQVVLEFDMVSNAVSKRAPKMNG